MNFGLSGWLDIEEGFNVVLVFFGEIGEVCVLSETCSNEDFLLVFVFVDPTCPLG